MSEQIVHFVIQMTPLVALVHNLERGHARNFLHRPIGGPTMRTFLALFAFFNRFLEEGRLHLGIRRWFAQRHQSLLYFVVRQQDATARFANGLQQV